MSEMAKKDTSIAFGTFPNADEFLLWVATYHGTNISETCRVRIQQAQQSGVSLDAIEDILNPLIRKTRQVDPAKNKIRAQFAW